MRIILTEFNDTPHFTQFEQCVVSLQPRECVLYKEDKEKAPNRFKKLETAIKRTGIQQTLSDELIDQYDLNYCKTIVKKLLQKKFASEFLSNVFVFFYNF